MLSQNRSDRHAPGRSKFHCGPLAETASDLLSWIFPVACLGCREALPRPPPLGLCLRCRARLRRLTSECCHGCALPSPGAGPISHGLCAACRTSPPAYDRLVAAWRYEPPLDAVVQALKFRRLDYLGKPLGRAAAEVLGPLSEGYDCIVPVPLHWRRQWRRGFNQAELIALGVAEARRLPILPLLRRARATPAQSGLPRRQRLAGPGDAFRCRRPDAGRGLAILLVDDVATTGATLNAAAACLRRTGATRICAMALGRTPPPESSELR